MNLKNKREAKPGSYVIGPVDGQIVAGKIHELTGKPVMLYPVQGRTIFQEIDPSHFYDAEDAMEACELINSGKVVPIEMARQQQQQQQQTPPPAAPPVVTVPAAAAVPPLLAAAPQPIVPPNPAIASPATPALEVGPV
jgi:hypothetical protein